MKRSALLSTVLLAATGCSLVDALSGDGPSVDPDGGPCSDFSRPECIDRQFTCFDPLLLQGMDDVVIDGCGQDLSEPPDACGQGFGEDAVFALDVAPGTYTLCTTGPPDSTFSIVRDCMSPGAEFTCLSAGGCTDVFIDGFQFVVWHARDLGFCGPVSLVVTPSVMPGSEFGAQCLDGGDNDGNGLTDCEESECKFNAPECQFEGGFEICDDTDDGFTPGTEMGSVDELACRCLSDGGCDEVGKPSSMEPYLCHLGFSLNGDFGGVCAPPCDNATSTWCQELGGVCEPDGRCVNQ